jgi:hypothetical protein
MTLPRALQCLVVFLSLILMLGADTASAQSAVVFSIGEGVIDDDGEVTVPIRVEDFEEVTGAQFSLRWDPALLHFKSTGAYGLSELNAANFGTPQSENIDEGTLTFAWDDPDTVGKTLASGATLFSITFTTPGSSAERAEVSFADKPTLRAVYIGLTEATFVANDGGATLPVELTAFTASTSGHDVVLRWETQSEVRNAGFSVEYRPASPSGAPSSFQEAAFVRGAGTTPVPQQYTHRVTDLQSGVYQFRLTQIDTDGTATRSPTVEAQVKVTAPYELSLPDRNPFQTRTQLELTVRRTQWVQATAYNMLGQHVKLIHQGHVSAHRPTTLQLDGGSLSSGVYVIHVRGETFSATRRVVLTR